ncbi:MAG TPA: hypothetical protein VF339_12320 [Gammaproteobacteria bacterium]
MRTVKLRSSVLVAADSPGKTSCASGAAGAIPGTRCRGSDGTLFLTSRQDGWIRVLAD